MRNPIVIESTANTYFIKKNGLPIGCQFCLKGAKAVLFINGFCQNPKHCWWYCPISENRKNKPGTYINEIQVFSNEDILKELKTINAKGMSFTGGDPLYEPNLAITLEYLNLVKKKMGKKFHIHLYTNGLNFNESIATDLAKAGLDEIRFNPPKDYWNVIELALNKGMSVGAEVPVIPKMENLEEIRGLIIYLNKIRADFINLNEFEYCTPNSQNLKFRNFKLEAGTIASVENSKKFALQLINDLAPKVSIKIHLCTIIAKDYWQLRERYLRRAKNIRFSYEEITKEGLLLYAQIEGDKSKIKLFYDILLNHIKVPKKYISLEKDKIKIPVKLALEDKFIELLTNYNLEGSIIEMTPFREKKYQQITEQSPLKLFKEEMGV